ncbi:MAG: ArsR/SmtB family transcription factor [Candidatus Oleimicrobiaceae bacterium]
MPNTEPHRQAAEIFYLLSHPARLHILDELRRGEACVCHLQAILQRPQPYVSQQLRTLRKAGLITSRNKGLFIYYRLIEPRVERLLEEILGPALRWELLPACSCPSCLGEATTLTITSGSAREEAL